MSTLEKYQRILTNLSRFSPVDLDALLDAESAGQPQPRVRTLPDFPPAAILWGQDADDNVSHIGIRITEPVESPETLVGMMAALAVEKGIIPIFISWIGDCGLQHFGMQVEQINGESDAAREHYEEQLRRMWGLAIVIDAKDMVASLR